MNRLAAGILVCVTVFGSGGGAQEPPPEGVEKTSCREAIKTQNRINAYFHRGVVPKLMACWNRLTSPGTVSVSFEFMRKGDQWVPGASYLRDSKQVSSRDAQLALGCLQAAVAGTAFAVDETDLDAPQFNVHWSFPLPWPRDLGAAVARFNTNNPSGGECGGSEGPPPACQNCFFNTTWHFSYCGSSCVGYMSCAVGDSHTCYLTPPKCATGSVFGNFGGVTMY